MTRRIRSWLDETHGAAFELVRHFLARLFDSEMVATPGEWRKVAIGLFAAVLSISVMGVKMYFRRYNHAQLSPSPDIYQQFVREDLLVFIGAVMVATVILTLLQWQSLFPSARDLMALAGLPISARQIFLAKFTALLLLFGAFALAAAGPASAVFATVTGGRWQVNHSPVTNTFAGFAALSGASVFVFFSLLSLQGILLNLLPARVFARVSLSVQAALFVATAAAAPLLWRQPAAAEWWPSVWFLRLWEQIAEGRAGAGRTAILAMAIPPMVCMLTYWCSYHRYRRMLLEAPRHADRAAARFGSMLMERLLPDTRQQAAFAFISKTLTRSRGHRLILLAYAGAALGWIVKGALDTPTPTLRDQGMYGFLTVTVPLALSMLVTAALRYVFGLPVALESNWIFRIIDRDGRTAWLLAMERFVIWCGVAPVFAVSLPAGIAVLGPLRAAATTALTFAAALLWFEAMFREWRKLPFTCSYLPAKKPILVTVLRFAFATLLLVPVGHVILRSSDDLVQFAALLSFQIVVWSKLRARRRDYWSACDLCFEEAPEADVSPLELKAAEDGIQAGVPERQDVEMFSTTLVASRGIVPHDWAEEIREERRRPSQLLGSLCEDVRFAVRLILRNPVIAGVIVATLTIGIGINASAFTALSGFALRPHVYKDPDSFVRVIPKTRIKNTARGASYTEYLALRSHSRSIRQLAAFAHFPAFIGNDDSGRLLGMAASCDIFTVDGLDRPVLGRLFNEDDCVRGRPAVAVIEESLWRARFAGHPDIIGRVIELNGRPARVVGVAPDRTTGWARPASVWVPLTANQDFFEPGVNLLSDEHLWLGMAGRLSPGFSRADAQAELTVLAKRHDRLHPGRDTVIVANDGSWLEEIRLNFSGQQFMLLAFFSGAFNLVLFVSCANVATLLLSRAAARRKEIAVRLSLGAPRIRLVRMLVTESLLLAAVAGCISSIIASFAPAKLFEFIAGRPADFPIDPDWRTFLFVTAVVTLTGVLSGMAPALESLKADLASSLKGGSPKSATFFKRGRSLHPLLVGAQVALSMVLLVEASLFARMEERTLRSDPGYRSRDIVVAPLWFPEKAPLAAIAARTAAVAERVRAVPGVHSVAFSERLPMWSYQTLELKPPGRPDAIQPVDVQTASPAFFDTLGVPVLRGREFELGEYSSVIVSQQLARAFWRRGDPIGKTLALPGGTFTVVGVVRDVDPLRFGGSENPVLYVPWRLRTMNMMSVRFDRGAGASATAVRSAIREVDPSVVSIVTRLQSWIDQVTKELWNVVGLIVMLGCIAVTLAGAGIYGAVSFAVGQRSKELAIRAALGARKIDIVWQVVASGGVPVLKGLLVGLWLSVLMAGSLHESARGSPLRLDTSNPLLYAGAAFVIAAAALLAMAVPAHRGATSDPLDALRTE